MDYKCDIASFHAEYIDLISVIIINNVIRFRSLAKLHIVIINISSEIENPQQTI